MKKLFTFLIVAIAMITVLVQPSKGQTTYTLIYLDVVTNAQNVPYCQSGCDSVKLVPPNGATNITWWPVGTYHGDTLVLPSGFGSGGGYEITCIYDQGYKDFYLHALLPPVQPTFADQTVCGIETVNLDAGNSSIFGFTQYTWSNGSTASNIIVGAGIYTVTVTNICALPITHSATITEFNPNQPDLGPDITVCQGSSVTLDPGTGYSDYLWFPGNSTDSILSPTTSGTYNVQTTNAIGGCIDNDTIQVTFLAPPSQDIDLVTIDTTNGNNRITWTDMYDEAVTINIYREHTTNDYILVGTAPYDNLTWTDTVDSKIHSWTYKIAIVDSCGNEGVQSPYVKSIHTWVTPVVGGGYTVQWTPYEVEAKEAVSQYNIYSGNQLSSLSYLDFVSGSVTVYTLSNFVDSLYVVGAQLGAKGATNDALSNWIGQNDAVGITDLALTDYITISPTLTDGSVTITTDLTIKEVKIYSALGQELLTTRDKNLTIPYHGLYLIHIVTDQGTMVTKVMVR